MNFPERNPTGEITHIVQKTSVGRFWDGIDASIRTTSGGYVRTPLLGRHIISTLLSIPVKSECRCDNRKYTRQQRPGEIDVIPVGYIAEWHDDLPTDLLLVELDSSVVKDAADAIGADSQAAELRPILQIEDPFVRHVLLALKEELEAEDGLGGLYAGSLALSLAAHLVRAHSSTRSIRVPGRFSRRQTTALLDFIEDHLAQNITIGELAQVTGLSQSHFKSLFRSSFGISPHRYVARARVDRATALLYRDKHSLSEIALMSGFADQSHMARWVRRMTGRTLTGVRATR